MINSTYLDYIEQETEKLVKTSSKEKHFASMLIKFVQDKCLQSYKSGYKNARERYQKQK